MKELQAKKGEIEMSLNQFQKDLRQSNEVRLLFFHCCHGMIYFLFVSSSSRLLKQLKQII